MKPTVGPKYKQIRDTLVEQFRRHRYAPGQKLPTEFELSGTLEVSRTTIRQSLALLEEEGWIERRHGSGSYYVGPAIEEDEDEPAKAGLIGLVNFFFMEYIYPDIIRGIEDTISLHGYSLVLAHSNMNDDKLLESIRRLLDQGIVGLILEPNHNLEYRAHHPILEMIEDLDIPVVTTHWGVGSKKVSTVTIDDVQAGYVATKYLIDLGHRDIAMIYKRNVQAGYDRFDGYKQALEEAGIPFNPEFVRSFDNEDEMRDRRQGYLLGKSLFASGKPRPTALFVFNDNSALQAYSAIKEAGLRIPEDISVIGFDNYHGTELIEPPLTTFEHPKYHLGKWAAKILLDELDEERPTLPMKLVFEPVLVERESVGPPPAK